MLTQPFASDKRVKTTTGRNERNWNMADTGEKKKNKGAEGETVASA